jgi:YegS/Rv2252/BmrU family lipid kinase
MVQPSNTVGPVAIVVNPEAGRGKPKKLVPELRNAFSHLACDLLVTTSKGEEEALARQAIRDGAMTIVAVGGDGTCSGVASAILQSGQSCRLAVVPCGTGDDFAKTLGVTGFSPTQVASLVFGGEVRRIDVGLADDRYFLNSCGFGFDASVLQATQKVRFLKGDAVYIYSALGQLFSYRGTKVSVEGDADVKPERMLMITVSNGRSLGGAFKIAPHASVLDGKLDACFFGDANVLERGRLFVGALRGTHLEMRGVSTAKVQDLTLTFAAPPSMEIDGELRTAPSATVRLRCVPLALSVLAAPRALV